MSKIEDVCLVGDGAHASVKRCETGVMYLTAKNFNTNGLDLSKTEFISEDDYKKHFCKKTNTVINVKKDDLVFSIIGSIGSAYVVKEGDIFGLSSSVAILRPDKKKLSSKFLYYWILSDVFQKYVENIKSGVAQGFLSLGMIKKLPVLMPPLPTQQKIADILSAYDDLIENNNRRIELLEQAAQQIYNEWFVRFRFPGYETAHLTNGIPDGWEVRRIGQFADVMSGGTPKTTNTEYYSGDIPFYTPKDYNERFFVGETQTTITHLGLDNCNSKLFPENTIIITARGTVGKISILIRPMAMNQSCYALKCDILNSPYYLFFSLKSEVDKLLTMANGGVFDTIIVSTFNHINMFVPSAQIINRFNKMLSPIMEESKILQIKTQNLIKRRDLLLPRLMSGKIEV